MLALRCSTPIYGGYNGGGGGYLSCCPCDVVRLYTGIITGEGGLPVLLALRCSTPIYGGYNGGGEGYLSRGPCNVVHLYTGDITGEEWVTCRVGLAV